MERAARVAQLNEIVQRVRAGRLRTNIGNVSTLDGAVAAFNSIERRKGKTIIRVTRGGPESAVGKLLPSLPHVRHGSY
jgi:hypothetical protein